MIAVVIGRHAVLSALLFLIPTAARPADDLAGAARELARRTAVYGRVDLQAIQWRNLSSLGPADLAQARSTFENALQETAGRGSSAPLLNVRITLSQNPAQYMLVEEAESPEERQVWIASWKRAGTPSLAASGMTLQSKLVWEQPEPILDVAYLGDATLVLSPSGLTLHAKTGRQSAPIAPVKPWPRDLRGRLKLAGAGIEAFLPGMVCSGSAAPALRLDCRSADEPWVIESGSRGILLAYFGGRNFFDGRIVTQSGARKSIPPFFSAAALDDQGRLSWLMAMLDGRTQIFDAAFNPQAAFTQWGSDIAALDARCGVGSQILATRPVDGSEPDAVQPFSVANGAPAPLAAPVIFPGPVTALWTSSADTAIAVARDLSTGKYGAYLLTIACGM